MLFGSYLNQSLWKLSPSFVKPCRIGIFVEVGGEKLSLAEKLVLAILEDHPKGTMNANRVMSRIPREARLNTDIVYKALLRLTHLNKAEQPSKGQFRIKHPAVKITGIIEFVRSGDGFVTPENAGAETKDIFIPSEWLNRSLPGDTVEVDVLGGGNRPTESSGLCTEVNVDTPAIWMYLKAAAISLPTKPHSKPIFELKGK
jgi:exoribonuclease R